MYCHRDDDQGESKESISRIERTIPTGLMDVTIVTPKDETTSDEIKEESPRDSFEEIEIVTSTKCGEVFSRPGGSLTLICAFCNDEFDEMGLFGDHLNSQDKCNYSTSILNAKIEVNDLSINDELGGLNPIADVDEEEVPPASSELESDQFTCLLCKQQYKTQRGLKRHQSLSRCGSVTMELSGEFRRKSRKLEEVPCGVESQEPPSDQEFKSENLTDLVDQVSRECTSDSEKNIEDDFHGEYREEESINTSQSEDEDEVEKQFSCNICNRVYKNNKSLARHMKTPHKIVNTESANDSWFCSPCNKPLNNRRTLQRHQRKHVSKETGLKLLANKQDGIFDETISRGYHCEICNTDFKEISELQIHSDIHDTLPAKLQRNLDFLICKYCNLQFPKYVQRLEHERTHTGDCPYECAYCKKGFATNFDRKVHTRSHTGQDRYDCPHCSKVFTNKTDVKRHIERHLNIRNFSCELCDKRFYRPFELTRHMRTHTKERPYVCEDCGATYPVLAQLKDHQLRHTGVKTIKCEICGRLFYSKSVLKVHMPTHFDEKPFECDVCGRKFSRAKAMHKHLKLHSGVKRYVCNICGKAYAQDSGLYAHKKTHGANVG